MTPLARAGEWGTLRRLLKRLSPFKVPPPHRLLVGPGDDAAVVKISTKSGLLFTTDTLVEGTHFRLDWLRRTLPEKEVWRALGYKAMAVNLSDLAAMGAARPLLALLTFGGGGDNSVETVENLSEGISKLTRLFGFSVLGGDTIRSDKTMLSVTIVGELITHKAILRSGARKGEVLMCSGPLGCSVAGLKVLSQGARRLTVAERFLLDRHLYPTPRLKEGELLGNEDNLSTSLMDASDDLFTSLEILSRESGVGFECDLSQVPVHPHLSEFCRARRLSPWEFVVYGGEDYELLFTAAPRKAPLILKSLPGAYVLGQVKHKSHGIRLKYGGKSLRLKDVRFRHF